MSGVLRLELCDVDRAGGMSDADRARWAALGEACVGVVVGATDLAEKIAERLSVRTLPGAIESTGSASLAIGSAAADEIVDRADAVAPPQVAPPPAATEVDPQPVSSSAASAALARVAPRRRASKAEVSEDESLYKAIVRPNQIPQVQPPTDVRPIEIVIVSDNTIRVRGRELELEGDQLFLLNALLMGRDRHRPSRELRGYGFRQRGSDSATMQHFSRAISGLAAALDRAANTKIIEMMGEKGGRTYNIAPTVTILDTRPEDSPGVVDGTKKA